MANTGDDHENCYWDTNRFYHNNHDDLDLDLDLDCWVGEVISGCYDSSSTDGAASPASSKNIVSERSRRKKLNDCLYTLRSVVPNITKLDKASVIKDAINYIQELQEQERRIQEEITVLESTVKSKGIPAFKDYDNAGELVIVPPYLRSKKKRTAAAAGFYDSAGSRLPPIEVLEMRVTYMGEKTVVVSLTCIKRTHTMLKLCEVFESLNLKVITANMIASSGRLIKTVFIEADELEKEQLKIKIEAAIAAMEDTLSPMSI